MYRCTNKECSLDWDRDYDKCPICRGYLIPASMVKVFNDKGVATMNAAKAKELTKTNEMSHAEKWWADYSPKLFKAIENQCKNRHYELQILRNDNELNEFNWINYYVLYDKAKEEMEKLGYTFKKDVDDYNEWVHIKW